MNDKNEQPNRAAPTEALKMRCESRLGVLDSSFLCQSLGALDPSEPECVEPDVPVDTVMAKLKTLRVGCVLVVSESGKLAGIFSERDFVTKVYGKKGAEKEPVSTFMTSEPQTATTLMPVAFALNLMSEGGFRHLPVVDEDGIPVAIVSIKDVVDFIVSSYVDDLLNFEEVE